MRRSVRNIKRSTTASKNEDNSPPKQRRKNKTEDSSSESDIENYLQPVDQIDLNSSFFQVEKSDQRQSFDDIESAIFAGTNRLSDSESESEVKETAQNKQEAIEQKLTQQTKLNFDQLHIYSKKIEEAKQMVQKYELQKKEKEKREKKSLDDDISNLLTLGETKVDEQVGFRTSIHSSDFESFSESDKEDWEEVEEDKSMPSCSVPKGVQITVALPDNMKKKKGVDLVATLKRRLNRIKKENQILIHKVHLLCWIAHGNYVNKVLNSESLLALSLSLIPSQHCYPPERTDLSYLEKIVNWFKITVPIMEKQTSKQWSLEKVLKLQLTRKQAYNKKMLVYIFICILRSLGIACRLVLSFQVVPLRPPNSELHSLSNKEGESSVKQTKSLKVESKTVSSAEKMNSKTDEEKNVKSSSTKISKEQPTVDKQKKTIKKVSKTTPAENRESKVEEIKFKKDSKDGQRVDTRNRVKDNENKKVPNLRNLNNSKDKKADSFARPSLRRRTASTKSSKAKPDEKKVNVKKISQLDGAHDSSDNEETKKKPNLKKILSLKSNSCRKGHSKLQTSIRKCKDSLTEGSEEEIVTSNNNETSKIKRRSLSTTSKTAMEKDVKSDIVSIVKNRIKQEKEVSSSKLVKNRRSKTQSDEDSDYAPEPVQKKSHSDDEFLENKVKVKKRVNPRNTIEPEEKITKGQDIWVEVFLEAEEKWISVDVVKGAVHCVSGLYTRASHPVSYIMTWNNNNSIKDVTQRYCPNWNTTTRRLRIDSKWWTDTLRPYIGQKTARDREEDEDLARLQLEKPLPTTISEYKNHPLYVLKRHLLKFEALYPSNPPTLGFIRKEAVYARNCVYVLHSREMWLKEAKVVKSGENPYKIVKARPKYDKLSGKVITDLPLEIFGIWQVEDYVPPTAENGVVPKSAYGSVELFKPCMLPKGTVHLQLPGLNKIARKMNIDTAPALVGFDFHGGWNHPIYDGYVVCEEFADSLVAAWYLEQEEQEKRELEKVEKRVYGNWKKLIKGLLIKERLKAKYNFGESSQSQDKKGTKRKSTGPKFVAKKRRICSDSDSD